MFEGSTAVGICIQKCSKNHFKELSDALDLCHCHICKTIASHIC